MHHNNTEYCISNVLKQNDCFRRGCVLLYSKWLEKEKKTDENGFRIVKQHNSSILIVLRDEKRFGKKENYFGTESVIEQSVFTIFFLREREKEKNSIHTLNYMSNRRKKNSNSQQTNDENKQMKH